VTAQLGMRLDALLGSVATTEARLAVTAGILLVTLAVGWLPSLGVRAAERVVTHWLERFLDGRAESSIETLQEAVPVSFGLRLFVGLLQLALFAIAAVAILALWGSSRSWSRCFRSRRTRSLSAHRRSSPRCFSAPPTSGATC